MARRRSAVSTDNGWDGNVPAPRIGKEDACFGPEYFP